MFTIPRRGRRPIRRLRRATFSCLLVFDRESQARVFETPVTTIANATAPVTAVGTHACPGLVGGVEWNGPAYHPGLNLIAVAGVDWCSTFYVDTDVRYVPGQTFLGGPNVSDTVS